MKKKILLAVLCFIFMGATITPAAFLTTTNAGYLIFEALDEGGRGATSVQEFGLGTPENQTLIFTIYLKDERIDFVTPSPIVNMGFFPGGSNLEFYNKSIFEGTYWGFSSRLNTANETASDVSVFTDPNNYLGLGGSIIEIVATDHWILHLDDAASYIYGDDNNELVIRVRVEPVESVPLPGSLLLIGTGLLGLATYR